MQQTLGVGEEKVPMLVMTRHNNTKPSPTFLTLIVYLANHVDLRGSVLVSSY